MAPCGLLHPLSSVGFERKIQFSASQDLYFARSKYFKLPEPESWGDAWSIKPPDFSLRVYTSVSVPQSKERQAHLNVQQRSDTKRKTAKSLTNVLHERYKRKDPPKFITSYRPPGALESELMFIRTGKYPSEPYQNPKPHNFRPLDETLPVIVTTYERDPGDLILKLKHLDTLRTTNTDPHFSSTETKTKMDTFKPAEPKWDARLILPQLPWPPKSASFTVRK
ncbi:hypothetical protein Q8A73_007502 [Channa argus]|nr:hypothetical protein Q8A73_007502 [Channa argus]